MDNDLEQFRAIEPLPLDGVRCPTLVVHGTHDRAVPFSHGETSAREIAGAEIHRVEKGWHLLALGVFPLKPAVPRLTHAGRSPHSDVREGGAPALECARTCPGGGRVGEGVRQQPCAKRLLVGIG